MNAQEAFQFAPRTRAWSRVAQVFGVRRSYSIIGTWRGLHVSGQGGRYAVQQYRVDIIL